MTTTVAPHVVAPGSSAPRPYRLDVHVPVGKGNESLIEDVRAGLSASPKWLLPKYLYDDLGCELYEQITDLPEYYQTRTELQILERECAGICDRHQPTELVELGSGSSRKTAAILDAMHAGGTLRRYLPFDIAPTAILDAAGRLNDAYPSLRIHGVAGDFDQHLDRIPRRGTRGRRLVAFLGGTIGNLHPSRRTPFLHSVAPLLEEGDVLLVGMDIAGDARRLEPAYDDAAGVTAAFNLNLLTMLNRELGADFDLDAFEHVATYDHEMEWVDLRLRSLADQDVRIPALGMTVRFGEGEEMRTELSCKFTRRSAAEMYAAAGLELIEWHTDDLDRFAVGLATLAR
jgi:L-histidine N-alpha-methyltransferase